MADLIDRFIKNSKSYSSLPTQEGRVKTKDYLQAYSVIKEDENPTGYLVDIAGERKFIIAKNISDAADRIDKLFSGKNWKFIHQESFDIVYE